MRMLIFVYSVNSNSFASSDVISAIRDCSVGMAALISIFTVCILLLLLNDYDYAIAFSSGGVHFTIMTRLLFYF